MLQDSYHHMLYRKNLCNSLYMNMHNKCSIGRYNHSHTFLYMYQHMHQNRCVYMTPYSPLL